MAGRSLGRIGALGQGGGEGVGVCVGVAWCGVVTGVVSGVVSGWRVRARHRTHADAGGAAPKINFLSSSPPFSPLPSPPSSSFHSPRATILVSRRRRWRSRV